MRRGVGRSHVQSQLLAEQFISFLHAMKSSSEGVGLGECGWHVKIYETAITLDVSLFGIASAITIPCPQKKASPP